MTVPRICAFVVGALAFLMPLQSPGLGELAWLEGEWERPVTGGIAVERWTRTDAGLMGEAVVVRDGRERQTEALLLVSMGGEVFYIAKPPENPYPVAFRMVSGADGRFVFENPTHDFPQRIIYRRTGENAMTASIEGPGDGGDTTSIDFEFVRR
jgi:hypothetical protein